MKLGDKASAGSEEEVRLARDSMGLYKIDDDELVPADEIGTDEFPQYGDFLPCLTSSGGRDPSWNMEVFVECPSSLAKQLVDMEIGTGDAFRINSVRKGPDGSWTYSVSEESPDL